MERFEKEGPNNLELIPFSLGKRRVRFLYQIVEDIPLSQANVQFAIHYLLEVIIRPLSGDHVQSNLRVVRRNERSERLSEFIVKAQGLPRPEPKVAGARESELYHTATPVNPEAKKMIQLYAQTVPWFRLCDGRGSVLVRVGGDGGSGISEGYGNTTAADRIMNWRACCGV